MSKHKKLKKLLPFLLLLPISSFGSELGSKVQTPKVTNDSLYLEISPTQFLILHLNTSKAIIVNKDEQKLLLNTESIEPVGVQFHEESSIVDFTTLDGITFHIPLGQLSVTPPNGLGF